jgi:short-subunit dehydrogenase
VKLIEPGGTRTDFGGRSEDRTTHPAYASYEQRVYANIQQLMGSRMAGKPDTVARAIFRAANSTSRKMRYPVNGNAGLMLWMRRQLPIGWWFAFVRSQMEKRPKS